MYANKRLYNAIKEKEELYINGDSEDEKVNDRLFELEAFVLRTIGNLKHYKNKRKL